ncbi:phage tail tape measure protein [Bacillus cereus]
MGTGKVLRTLLNITGLKEGRIKAAEFGQGVDKAMKEALD